MGIGLEYSEKEKRRNKQNVDAGKTRVLFYPSKSEKSVRDFSKSEGDISPQR